MGRREGSKEEAANRATEEWVVNPQADALSAPKLPFLFLPQDAAL